MRMMSQKAKTTKPGYNRNSMGLEMLMDKSKDKPSAAFWAVLSVTSKEKVVLMLERMVKPKAHFGEIFEILG